MDENSVSVKFLLKPNTVNNRIYSFGLSVLPRSLSRSLSNFEIRSSNIFVRIGVITSFARRNPPIPVIRLACQVAQPRDQSIFFITNINCFSLVVKAAGISPVGKA